MVYVYAWDGSVEHFIEKLNDASAFWSWMQFKFFSQHRPVSYRLRGETKLLLAEVNLF